MRARSAARGVMWALVLCVTAKPAAGFWPLTSEFVPATRDTAADTRLDKRFHLFEAGKPEQQFVPFAAPTAPMRSSAGVGAPASADSTTRAANSDSTRLAAPTDSTAVAASVDSVTQAARDSLANASTTPGSNGTGGTVGTGTGTGAGTPGAGVAASAAAAAAAQMMAQRGYAPDFTSSITMSNDRQTLNSNLTSGFTDASGVVLSNSLGYDDDVTRTQKIETQTYRMTNNLSVPLKRRGLSANASTMNLRSNTTGQKAINGNPLSVHGEIKSAVAGLVLSRRLTTLPGGRALRPLFLGWSANTGYNRSADVNATNRTTTNVAGSSRTKHRGQSDNWGVGVSFDRWNWMTASSRYGNLRRANKDQIVNFVRADSADVLDQNSTSKGDTATVDVSMTKLGGWAQSVTLNFRSANGSDTHPDQARTSSGAQTGALYTFETVTTFSQSFNAKAQLTPWTRYSATVTVNASRDSTTYATRSLGFNDTKRAGWKLESKLLLWKDTSLSMNYESNATDANLDGIERTGPDTGRRKINTTTRGEEGRKLYTEFNTIFTPTMRIRAFAEIQLDQSFYKHPVVGQGLGDADLFRTRAGIDLTGNMSKTVMAQVTAYVRTYDQAFIDPLRSASTTNEIEYVVWPGYTWQLDPRVGIEQRFGLSSKVLDNVFDPSRSTLNRNHFMKTYMRTQMTKRLHLDLSYEYGLQDNGSYTSLDGVGPRLFGAQARTKTDQIGVAMRYDLISGDKLSFVSDQYSRRTYRFGFNGRPPEITEAGNLALGVRSKLQIGGLSLDSSIKRNQNKGFAGNDKVFYNADTKLSYTF